MGPVVGTPWRYLEVSVLAPPDLEGLGLDVSIELQLEVGATLCLYAHIPGIP